MNAKIKYLRRLDYLNGIGHSKNWDRHLKEIWDLALTFTCVKNEMR